MKRNKSFKIFNSGNKNSTVPARHQVVCYPNEKSECRGVFLKNSKELRFRRVDLFCLLVTKVIAFNEGKFGTKNLYKSAVTAHPIFCSGKKQTFRTN